MLFGSSAGKTCQRTAPGTTAWLERIISCFQRRRNDGLVVWASGCPR